LLLVAYLEFSPEDSTNSEKKQLKQLLKL